MSQSFADAMIELLPRLRRFAMSLTGKADEADDLVQAACERALRAEDRFEPGTRLDAWLFRIIKNLWIDQVRRRQTENTVELPDDEHGLPYRDEALVVESRLMLGQVEDAMTRLSPDYQRVLRVICVDGASYQDAATTLDIPIGTVMSRLSRARKALMDMLEKPNDARAPRQESGR